MWRRGNPKLISRSEYVFPNNIRKSWYSFLKRIGIENFRWHDLRHCCASYMRQDGKSLGLIGNPGINLQHLRSDIRTLVRRKLLRLGSQFLRGCMDKLILNAYKNAYKMDFENTLNCKSLKLNTEMDASLVGAPDFKPACAALTLS